ncbi:MAG: hypothetical protein JKY18_11225 [Flavobacteriales bacterium]|nr:hypothetical protein [Flavobacteriales bacterium]
MKLLQCGIWMIGLAIFSTNVTGQSVESMYLGNQTATYEETIAFYKTMAENHSEATLLSFGKTDVGKPLSLFVISADGDFNPVSLRSKNKRVLFINNAIHPGEPCGVDACIKLTKQLLDGENLSTKLGNVVVCIVPMYNIGGALNRGCCSRANQNGPEAYGFRGNAKNLDLNRDFIKADSRNARGFAMMFTQWDPDVFIDTHTSNGADYQYVMTLITTQLDKLHPSLSTYVKEKMNPVLYEAMEKNKYEMIPYVNSFGKTPESGIIDFLETPRYSTGYAALFNTIGFTTESHMFKPFKDRVLGTWHFINSVIDFVQKNHKEIGEVRAEAKSLTSAQISFDIAWAPDTTKYDIIPFKGFESGVKTSKISGTERSFYDREKPYTKDIKYYNRYKASVTVNKPSMYIIPQGWERVIQRLRINGIGMRRLLKDTLLAVEIYYIDDYSSTKRPYEGHYLHKNVKVSAQRQTLQFYQGDFVIETNQDRNRFIVETLEPQGVDSYFAWNFFDPILQQKEWFSSYVFEERAETLLKENPDIKRALDEKVGSDTAFAASGRAQLRFIYERSPYFEKSRNRYPVARVMESISLPLR